MSRFGDDIAVVHHDNYYKRQDCSFEERCKQNYDHPDAFDTDLMIQDLKKLKAGHNLVALDLIMQRIANHIAEN